MPGTAEGGRALARRETLRRESSRAVRSDARTGAEGRPAES